MTIQIDPDTQKVWLFAPSGKPINAVVTSGYRTSQIYNFNTDGEINNHGCDDLDRLEVTSLPDGSSIWSDSDSAEWLPEHCREVVVPIDFDWSDELELPPWPEAIQHKCIRMLKLMDGLRLYADMFHYLPTDYRDDPNIGVVARRFIEERAKAEIEELRTTIDAFRKTVREPTHLGFIGDDEPETEEAEA